MIFGHSAHEWTYITDSFASCTNNNNNNNNNLSIEIRRMWNMKCIVIPATIGATGTVTEGLKKIWKQYQESIQ
jgi:hypothetical protein